MSDPVVKCPKCGADISDSYGSWANTGEPTEDNTMAYADVDSGWFCAACDSAEGYVPDTRDHG